jgi:hypothetical protein
VCRGKHPVAKIVPSSPGRPGRPKVGQLTSPRFTIPEDAFAPLSAEELRDWGLG